MSCLSRTGPAPRSSFERGFTLIELMVVVTIIAIVAVLAIPSMSHEGYDRRAFTDASSIAELVREARTRAVARGAAELLIMNADPGTNTASFTLYEAVSLNPGGVNGSNIPVSTCNPPVVWPGGAGTVTANFVDGFQISPTAGTGQSLEALGDIRMRVNDPAGTVLAAATNMYLCFTPSGRVQYQAATNPAPPFAPMASLCAANQVGCVGAVTVDITRGAFPTGTTSSQTLIRTVWIPSTGATRITSQ